MYIKTKKNCGFEKAEYYIYTNNVWVPYDKYGKNLLGQVGFCIVNNPSVFAWAELDEVTFHNGHPEFEINIKYPLVGETDVYFFVMRDMNNGIAICKKNNNIEKSYSTAKQLVEDKTVKILDEREKGLVLCGLNLKELVSAHCG